MTKTRPARATRSIRLTEEQWRRIEPLVIEPTPQAGKLTLRAAEVMTGPGLWQWLSRVGYEMWSGATIAPTVDPNRRRRERALRTRSIKTLRNLATVVDPSADTTPLLVKAIEELIVLLDGEATRNSPGPKPKAYGTAWDGFRALRVEGFDYADMADLVLSSDADWSRPPCSEVVREHADEDGRERLRKQMRQIARREEQKAPRTLKTYVVTFKVDTAK